MKRKLTLAMLCTASLAGCAPTGNDTIDNTSAQASAMANQAGTEVKAAAVEAAGHAQNLDQSATAGFYQGVDHVADWIKPTPPKGLQAIPASYCYHVYQDILCYRRPMPGWENRLAGYQPLDATPPPPAMMQPLPVRAADPSRAPANRTAESKPVFAEVPKPVEVPKPAEDNTAAPAVPAAPDASHEQLPDPALAPQL